MCIRDSGVGEHLRGDEVLPPDLERVEVELAAHLVDGPLKACLLYTSDAADDLLCVDLGGRRLIKKKNLHVPASCLPTCIHISRFSFLRRHESHYLIQPMPT